MADAMRPGRALTLAITFALALGYVMAMLDATAVNVALVKIRGDFGAPLSALVRWLMPTRSLSPLP